MSDTLETASSSSGAPPPKRTYGRAKVAVDSASTSTSMVFAPQPTLLSATTSAADHVSPSKNLLNRFSAKNSNWRESLIELDASRDEVDEDEVKAARERFRKANARSDNDAAPHDSAGPGRMLSAFSSSTLTDPPTSTPPLKASDATPSASTPPSSPPASAWPPAHRPPLQSPSSNNGPSDDGGRESDDEGDISTVTARAMRDSVTPVASPTVKPLHSLFDDEDSCDGAAQDSSSMLPLPRPSKGLSKAEAEMARRDAVRALRERPAEVSRPEPTRRPVTEWISKANLVAASTFALRARTHPGTSPEDIRQFTPSSAPKDKPYPFSSQEHHEVLSRPTSSPTPRIFNKAAVSQELDDDDDEVLTLDAALKRDTAQGQQKEHWAALKAQALKAQANARLAHDEDDDGDFTIIPDEPPAQRKASGGARALSNARAGLNRYPAPTASFKQKELKFGSAGRRMAKQPVTETHINFAARNFAHANLKHANGGSRPAGQKPGRDTPVTHAQISTRLVDLHHKQAHELQLVREEKYGAGRLLPEKQKLDLSATISSTARTPESDDSDSDFAPDDDREAESDAEVANDWSGDDEGAEAAMPTSVQDSVDDDLHESDADPDDQDKENRPLVAAPIVDSDDDNDVLQPVKKRNARTRVSFLSDDEGDADDGVRDQTLREATHRLPAPSTAGPSLSDGFGFGDDSFSQLFAETQADGICVGDAFGAIRDNATKALLPSQVFLPSVQISDTQKKRDNALIAAEVEKLGTAEAQEPRPAKQFFTQTRPKDHSSQLVGSGLAITQLGTNLNGDIAPSSTLLNASERLSDPTSPTMASGGEMHLTRIRPRQHSPLLPNASPERSLPPRTRNVFDILHAGAARQATVAAKGHHSELIDAQAEESDDENGWGLFTSKEADDDEDGDETGYVPELVDDAAVAEDVRAEQDALAASRHREAAQADDARREAMAKRVTEGHYRHKRRGNEFLSDDEEDEEGRPRRLTKKQRRQRMLDREDGLFKLGDESNVFLQAYADDLESDNEFDESPLSPSADMSPGPAISARDRDALLRQRARMNTDAGFAAFAVDIDEDEDDSGFRVSRAMRRTAVVESEEHEEVTVVRAQRGMTSIRSVERYSKFVSDESLNPRRNGGAGGISVVVQKSSKTALRLANAAGAAESGRSLGNQASGSVLLGRGNRFG